MTSNGKTTNTKVVDLEKLCNFVVDNLFEIISPRKFTFEFLTFGIQNFETISDRESNKTKVVDFNNIYNFAVEKFSI